MFYNVWLWLILLPPIILSYDYITIYVCVLQLLNRCNEQLTALFPRFCYPEQHSYDLTSLLAHVYENLLL